MDTATGIMVLAELLEHITMAVDFWEVVAGAAVASAEAVVVAAAEALVVVAAASVAVEPRVVGNTILRSILLNCGNPLDIGYSVGESQNYRQFQLPGHQVCCYHNVDMTVCHQKRG